MLWIDSQILKFILEADLAGAQCGPFSLSLLLLPMVFDQSYYETRIRCYRGKTNIRMFGISWVLFCSLFLIFNLKIAPDC
jgi:hypothetical protein